MNPPVTEAEFWANDPGTAWQVLEGAALLFVVTDHRESAAPPRFFAGRIPTGAAFVGAPDHEQSGGRLLCVCTPGTVVKSMPVEQSLVDDGAKGLSRWMREALADSHAGAGWTQGRESALAFDGAVAEQRHADAAALVRDFAAGLFSRTASRSLAGGAIAVERLLLAAGQDDARFDAAMTDIAKGNLDRDALGRRSPSDDAGDGLLAACRFLEPSRNIRFVAYGEGAGEGPESVEKLAEASGVRARRVLLDGRWWREEGGPLLARYRSGEDAPGSNPNGHWVALIPGRVSGYCLFSGRAIPGIAQGAVVDDAIAQRLSPFAFTFFRTFPARALSLVDVTRFGFSGKGRDASILVIASIVAGLLGLAMPLLSGRLVDHVLPSHQPALLWPIVATMLLAGVMAILFEALRTVAWMRVEARTGVSLQAAVIDRVISLPTSFFRKYASGDLSVRMTALSSIQQTVTQSAVGIFLTAVFLAGSLALMCWYSLTITLSVLLVTSLLLGTSATFGYLRLRRVRKIEELGGTLRAQVFEFLSGITKIRTHVAEKRVFVNWSANFLQFRLNTDRNKALANREMLVFNLVNPGMLLLVYYLATTAGAHGSLTGRNGGFSTGDFVAFNTAMFGVVSGLLALMHHAIDMILLVPIWERTRPILETLPETTSIRRKRYEPSGGIEVVDLSFRYPEGPEVISNVSLKIEPGAFVAIVGSSGSGKSTLLRLLLGFEQPGSGSVCFDGHDLAGLDVRFLRSRIGTVLQSGRLWPGNILANIVGSGNHSIEDAWAAADRVGLRADIEAMPMGMYTVIGEGESTLSGGQRQRIAIARALIHRPRILLLDEATSALDNVSQAVIERTMSQLDCTRLVIAHRLTTVRRADLILVLDHGRIVEQGTFDQLAAQDKLFSRMLQRQIA